VKNGRHDSTLPNPSVVQDTPPEGDLRCIQAKQIDVRPEDRLVSYTDPSSRAADTLRLLCRRLRKLWTERKVKSILVTSPLPKEGKSTIALNLATALVQQRYCRVLLLDCDLHRSSLTQQLGLTSNVGLAECLEYRVNALSAIQRIEPLGLYFLPAGVLPIENPTELLQTQALPGVIQEVSGRFDWVVIDSPPVLSLSDAISLADHVDGTLLVARAGCTSSKAVDDTIALLGSKQVLGLVLNGVQKLDRPYARYDRY
jgi:capsular exopolysaccharide synthesis family protein